MEITGQIHHFHDEFGCVCVFSNYYSQKNKKHYLIISRYLLHPSHCTGTKLHAALINGMLQILATEIAAHLTEYSCHSEQRRDIN